MIKTDQWVFLGIAPVPNVPFPLTRVLVEGVWHIETWDRKQVAEMSIEEAERFPLRSNHSGMLMQEALLHYFSFLVADEYMQKFLPELRLENVLSVSTIKLS
jgi:hypothetical protein